MGQAMTAGRGDDDGAHEQGGPGEAVRIAPSMLSSDFGHLADEVIAVTRGGADLIHVDVMDGHFVPNLTIGPVVVRAIRRAVEQGGAVPVDTHLMITHPERYIKAYVDAGSDWLTVHAEACVHLDRVVQQIRQAGAAPGVSINPHTHENVLEYVLEGLNHVLVMSVNPGFGGQSFIPAVLPKIERLRERIERLGLDVAIEVDGGVKASNIASICSAGATVFVAGSAVFGAGGQPESYGPRIAALKMAARDPGPAG